MSIEQHIDVDMAMVYVDFVLERHRVWERRQMGAEPPWTDDPVLAKYKFTNVYRVLDHGSQFLLRELLQPAEDLRTVMMRAFLYRYTNRPEPWIWFKEEHGRYPVPDDLPSFLIEEWKQYQAEGGKVFGTAYKMFVGGENKGTDRVTWAVNLTREHFGKHGFYDIVPLWGQCSWQHERLDLLRTIPRCKDFMAMQVLTDIGYVSRRSDENEFVIPGPGAKRGAAAVFPKGDATDAIHWARRQFTENGPRLLTPSGRERPPSLMDIQNTFCEFSKYVRYLEIDKGRGHKVAHPGPQPKPVLPKHW